MIMKADTVIAPNRPSRAVFELGSDWRTVTFCFPAVIFGLTMIACCSEMKPRANEEQ